MSGDFYKRLPIYQYVYDSFAKRVRLCLFLDLPTRGTAKRASFRLRVSKAYAEPFVLEQTADGEGE
jgi:hypothetical protein